MYLLVYVDDLIHTGNYEDTLHAFVDQLNKEFAIKDLGDLGYFLVWKLPTPMMAYFCLKQNMRMISYNGLNYSTPNPWLLHLLLTSH